jgi:16S rRNA (cytidine1402-2'-O)-methyltransferase
MFGTLYVVSTPIGNLEDVTLRALRVLKEATVIAAEDTRHTARLLQRYEIRTPTTSFHEHNERRKLPALVAQLKAGDSIALVSDAGTPGVRDPGYRLVRQAIDEQIRVEVIPGPSAVLTALVASGLPIDAFTFVGFPPSRSKARADWLAGIASEIRTVVFFEAPHRIRATLEDLARLTGDRPVVVARELTKLHEEVLRGTASSVLGRLGEPRGEFTVVVAPGPGETAPASPPTDECISRAFTEMVTASDTNRRGAISALARRYGMASSEIYAAIEREKARHHRE